MMRRVIISVVGLTITMRLPKASVKSFGSCSIAIGNADSMGTNNSTKSSERSVIELVVILLRTSRLTWARTLADAASRLARN